MHTSVLQTLAISLGLGLLVGLQREWSRSPLGGIRTFPLITLLGSICSLLAASFGGWIVAAGLFAVAGIVVIAYIPRQRDGHEIGVTTEVAAVLMYGVGAYLAQGNQVVAIAVGGVVAVLLHLKQPMHNFVQKVGEHDIRAIMQFVVISLVILPVLPDRAFGPYAVLNPHSIWRMVVLIVGIGLSGYVAYKLFGSRAGTLLGGILGGMISSTATTVSYSRRTKALPQAAPLAALVIFIASTVAFARIILEVAAVAPESLPQIAPPLVAMLVFMTIVSVIAFFLIRGERQEMPEQGNPAHLRAALVFAGLYALVILGIAAAKDHFGNSGLYIIAMISGLTDMDAITLSASRMVHEGRIDATTGWELIMIGSLANLVFKGGLVAILGSRRAFLRTVALFAIAFAAGLAILWAWPADFAIALPAAPAELAGH